MKVRPCQNSATALVSFALHGMGTRAAPSGHETTAEPIALFSFPRFSLLSSMTTEVPHRQSCHSMRCRGRTVTTSMNFITNFNRRVLRQRGRRGGGGVAAAVGENMSLERRGSSLTPSRPSAHIALSMRARVELWGTGSDRGSDDEVSDGADDDGREKNEPLGNDAGVGSTMANARIPGGNSEPETSSELTYPLNASEGDEETGSLPSSSVLERNARDSAVENGDISSDDSIFAWLPRFFPEDRGADEEGTTVKPLVELPLDGTLLQLIPALLIAVLGLVLTVAVQVEAGRFDGMAGEDGESAVVVTDLREQRSAPP